MKIVTALFLLITSPVFAAEVPAEYEVPVPAELTEFSRYPMEAVHVENNDGEVRVRYPLPISLTGEKNMIEMIGRRDENGVLKLTGPNSAAECDGMEAGQKCQVRFTGVKIDLDLVAQELEKLRRTPRQIAGFMQVSAMLKESGGDMRGTIHYKPYGASAQLNYTAE